MKRLVLASIVLTILSGCATTGTVNIQKGVEKELQAIEVVKISRFECQDKAVEQAVQNSIIETLLPLGIKVVGDGEADAIIEGTITFSEDIVASSGASVSEEGGGAYGSGTAGRYVSGITVRILKGNKILAVSTVTQVRTSLWIPDPAEVMCRKIGKKISQILE